MPQLTGVSQKNIGRFEVIVSDTDAMQLCHASAKLPEYLKTTKNIMQIKTDQDENKQPDVLIAHM